MRLIFVSLLLTCLSSMVLAKAPAQIAVSPDLFRINLDDKRPQSLTVMNLSDRTIEASASISGWTLENDKIVPTPPSPTSLDQWIILNPVDMKIAPGDSQIVRFAIRPPVKPAAGEHRAMLWIEEKLKGTAFRSIKARFRLGVAIYADQDPVDRRGEFIAAQFDHQQNRLELMFSNKGNAHDRPFGKLTVESSELEEPLTLPLPQRPILPGQQASQYIPLPPLKAGQYRLGLEGHFYEEKRDFKHRGFG